jgi:hypothetical protein
MDGYSAALLLLYLMELLAAAIIMMRQRSTRLVAGQYVRKPTMRAKCSGSTWRSN